MEKTEEVEEVKTMQTIIKAAVMLPDREKPLEIDLKGIIYIPRIAEMITIDDFLNEDQRKSIQDMDLEVEDVQHTFKPKFHIIIVKIGVSTYEEESQE